ncbi:MAG: hypothetical protein K6E81_06920 [Lachnospiraceae bacterium]|nr:hypothetical protein [Lachnospiraceae bacterium]
MVITSLQFLIFTAVSLLIYWKLPKRFQWMLLLADSLVFYFVNCRAYTFLYVIGAVGAVYAATCVFVRTRAKGAGEEERSQRARKVALVLALLSNLALLAVLKYSNLGIHTVNTIAQLGGGKRPLLHEVHFPAPLAISFYTLSLLSYLIDCYWGSAEPERNPLKVLLFTMYFPLMVSGPISRYREIGGQLFEEHRFDYDRVASGLRRAGWGFAKKCVVADRLSYLNDQLFLFPDIYSGIWVLGAAVLYSVQLYFDFSGCMDIVLGISECFGIRLSENFKAPFFSVSIQEIWQRWHVALGSWLNDYLLYPLMKTKPMACLSERLRKKYGKRGRHLATYPALLVLWSAMGLWHGDSWKYILGEGWWFFFVIVCGQLLAPVFATWKKKLHIRETHPVWIAFQRCRTVLLFGIGMIFFRADSYPAALHMLGRLFVPTGIVSPLRTLYYAAWEDFGGWPVLAAVVILFVLQMMADAKVYRRESAQTKVKALHPVLRWSLYLALIFTTIFLGAYGRSSFIYFGF